MADNRATINLSASFVSEDDRYPLMILDVGGEKTGHVLNLNTLEFRRVCLCSASGSDECICGAWDTNAKEYNE